MSVDSASRLAALLAVTSLVVVVVMGAGLVGGRFSARLAAFRDWGVAFVGPMALWLAWIVAAVSLVGSVYFSEVADFAPCNLCWYQRIAMYPLAIILAIAALRDDAGVRRYVLPLVGVGSAFSVYHHALQTWPSLETGICGTDVSCAVRDIWEFGFVSFPLMALAGFLLVAALLLVAGRAEHTEISQKKEPDGR